MTPSEYMRYLRIHHKKPEHQMVKTYGMQDWGKRLEHMMDLQDLWSGAYAILTGPGWHNPEEERQAKELEIALKLLGHHMQNDFDATQYAKVINDLPKKAEEIQDALPPIPKREHNE